MKKILMAALLGAAACSPWGRYICMFRLSIRAIGAAIAPSIMLAAARCISSMTAGIARSMPRAISMSIGFAMKSAVLTRGVMKKTGYMSMSIGKAKAGNFCR